MASLQADYLTQGLRTLSASLQSDGHDEGASFATSAADTIEALQQRCEELEAYSRGLIGRQDVTMDHIQEENEEQRDRIAALEDALKNLISAARGMPMSYDNLCQGGLDHAVELAEQALTSSEGAGGMITRLLKWLIPSPRPRCTCSRDLVGRIPTKNPRCPIHSPTSAAEGREDG